jgi:type II secretory pathway component GspD/PulD (secretin)
MGLRLIAALLAISVLCLADDDSPKELAMALARKAKKAEKAGQSAQAYLYYSEAAALQPANRGYKSRMELLQTKAARQSKPVPQPAAEGAPELPAPDLSPEDVFDSMTEKEMSEARELNAPPTLHAKPGTQSFDLNGDARTLFDKVAQAFGLESVYDGDYPRSGTQIRFRVGGADYREALHDLEAATGSFVIPLSGRLFMVAQDTPAKRTDLEQTMAIAVPVPQAITTQELTELAQVMRQATNVEKIAWESAQSRIVMRDRVSRVLPAVALLNQLLSYRPEVMVDLEFLQLDSSDILNYGFNVTNNFSAVYLGNILNNVASVPSGVTNLLTFGAGKTLIGISAAQVQAMFNETKSNSGSLYSAQLRAVSGMPSTLHVGEKYPVITSGYFGGTSTASTGTTYAPPPSFTFMDLGLEMKITPYVNGAEDTTLAVETTFQVLSGQSVNNIPIIGNRSLKSQVSMRNGEWALIGTLLNKSDSKAVSGFWGLSQLPFLGQLFKQTSTDKEESQVLIGIRTHLLSLPASETVHRALRVGTDQRPFTPL